MKKIVFIFGLIAGLIVTTMMLGTTIACYRNEDFAGQYGSWVHSFAIVIFDGI